MLRQLSKFKKVQLSKFKVQLSKFNFVDQFYGTWFTQNNFPG